MHCFIRSLIFFILGFYSLPVFSGQQSFLLKTQIELLPSCLINDQKVISDQVFNFGQINFGEVAASFNGVIEGQLHQVNAPGSGIKIWCSSHAPVKLTFDGGRHRQNIPSDFAANYFRALSNGKDYLAYNLLYGAKKQVLKSSEIITIPNDGKVFDLELSGQVTNNGHPVSIGQYTDTVSILIEF
ncbi:spore coat protein U domain-containing protein [Acinetobacter sp. A47]|uniref:spore coat protein U domain-containing protein n=1 Tax=Acinetobacter sp. A47 TaxID=1561217 RepID=UPI00056F20A6|nr:spore coat protein U domain-containing protein [Acinetobacter sp. A47]